MWKFALLPVLVLAPTYAAAQPVPPAHQASVNPRANELFDREPVLKAWALRIYDRNHDGWLTLYEAQAAADSFRDIADGNRDGRVSLSEYAAAIDFVRARY